METLASTLQKLWSRLPILKCRSNSKVKDKGTEWYPKKGLVTRMNYVKYECTNPNPFKVTVKVCFLKVGQTPRSRSKFLVSYKWSSQNDYIYVSMKALFLTVKKLWPRLKFFPKDGNLQGQGQNFIVVGIQ